MSYVDEVIERVVKENPNEPEFHQAVKEVLESLRPVVDANEPAFRRDALLERLVNPERQIKFRVPWIDDSSGLLKRLMLNSRVLWWICTTTLTRRQRNTVLKATTLSVPISPALKRS